eukprot:SM000016S01939  [mRNA]  locus=s16:762582:774087:- [translate_table: standard]
MAAVQSSLTLQYARGGAMIVIEYSSAGPCHGCQRRAQLVGPTKRQQVRARRSERTSEWYFCSRSLKLLPIRAGRSASSSPRDSLQGAQTGSGDGQGNGAAAPPTLPEGSLMERSFEVVTTSKHSKFDIDYLGESTKGDMKLHRRQWETWENEGVTPLKDGDIETVSKEETRDAEDLLDRLSISAGFPYGLASRGIYCSRTLNLRSITTIGYDMDYTLIHYNVNAWEGRAYDYGMANLRAKGYPVDGLKFDPDLVIRGLIVDKENGNLVKADRFGYVKRAMHGTQMLSNRAISGAYGREFVDLRDEHRWEFLNTLFSVSEAVMYMQMVEQLDAGRLPPDIGPQDYQGLFKVLFLVVSKALFRAHVEGQLKAEIINAPDKFVELDPELPMALLDQKEAGKRLLLITNSDYQYTRTMMEHSFDRFLPNGIKWRKLFDMVIVSAQKPDFFSKNHPLYEIVTEDGLMRPCFKASSGGLYCGGSAQMVEKALGFAGQETLYVGDHIYTDVSQSKVHLRWRTALILRELEKEVDALEKGREHREKLIELMARKDTLGDVFNQLRLALQRRSTDKQAQTKEASRMSDVELTENMQRLLVLMERLDHVIAPMLEHDGHYFSSRWGYLSRSGLWDKSHLTRQTEKYADIYTSRVSNFLRYTPFMYFRAHSQSLAHDRNTTWADCKLENHPEEKDEMPENGISYKDMGMLLVDNKKRCVYGSMASAMASSQGAGSVTAAGMAQSLTSRSLRPVSFSLGASRGPSRVEQVFQQRCRSRGSDLAAATRFSSLQVLTCDACSIGRTKEVDYKFPELFGEVRDDPYYWLRDDDRKNSEVLEHLKAENAYVEAVMGDTKAFQDDLYLEMRAKIKEDDSSVPIRKGPYYYYTRTVEGEQYRVHCRRSIADGEGEGAVDDVMDTSENAPPEEVLLDENKKASSFDFYKVAGFKVSQDHKFVAYAEDTEGGEKHTLGIWDLATNAQLGPGIPATSGDVAWANDNKTVFYITKDKLDRPYKVWRHTVGADPSSDTCVFHEEDESFYLSLSRSESGDYLFLAAGSAVTSHEFSIPTTSPQGEWTAITPRVQDVEASVTHRGDHFFIIRRTEENYNSELLVCPVSNFGELSVLLPHRPSVKLEGIQAFRDHLVLFVRENGLQGITVYELPPVGQPIASLPAGKNITFDEEAYSVSEEYGQYKSAILRFGFTSLKTPYSTFDYDMRTGKRALKRVQPVLGGFDKDNYATVRRWATAEDNTKVPISIVYRKEKANLDGTDPVLLNGYGAYEIPNDPYFNSNILPLLDRGVTFAMAHIRGGGELGRKWYEDGKYLKKKNTFSDFIACSQYLIEHKWAARDKLCIEGRSAGGLLIGAVLNMRPDLFRVAFAGVPFVDIVTTMLDPSIPLTTIEWEEWGNPSKEEYFKYMRSYSPVDNVTKREYPNILVTAGLHDPRVGYWEPAKWVAKLRKNQLNESRPIVFKCDLGAGHFSKSGRFDKLKERAFEYSFTLKCLGLIQESPSSSRL